MRAYVERQRRRDFAGEARRRDRVRRGDLVTVAISGDYARPRPALIVQGDVYAEQPSLTVLPLTSEL